MKKYSAKDIFLVNYTWINMVLYIYNYYTLLPPFFYRFYNLLFILHLYLRNDVTFIMGQTELQVVMMKINKLNNRSDFISNRLGNEDGGYKRWYCSFRSVGECLQSQICWALGAIMMNLDTVASCTLSPISITLII